MGEKERHSQIDYADCGGTLNRKGKVNLDSSDQNEPKWSAY